MFSALRLISPSGVRGVVAATVFIISHPVRPSVACVTSFIAIIAFEYLVLASIPPPTSGSVSQLFQRIALVPAS